MIYNFLNESLSKREQTSSIPKDLIYSKLYLTSVKGPVDLERGSGPLEKGGTRVPFLDKTPKDIKEIT